MGVAIMSAIRGIQEKHEHAAQKLARDTRPLGTRVAEYLSNPTTTCVISGTGVAIFFIFPAATDFVFLLCLMLFIFAYTRKNTLPFRLPRSSKALDYNDLVSGTVKAKMAGGISFFGNDRVTGEELWFTDSDLRTHILIFGSTGSGKTEALVSIAFNSLIHGSGFIYVDGKGDNSLFAKIFSMVRRMGRDDDILLINFMTGARDVIGAQESRLSNTMNPFATGSSSMLAGLATSLMDSGSSGSGGDMWKGRAINFVESLMKIMCAMRDAGHILMDANSIREYFILEKLESIVVDKKFPVGESGYMVPIEAMPKEILEPLKNYILNLPGYNPKKKGDQAGEVREQHGFITMQLTRVFGSLADTYGHIMRTNLAEVDLKDVVLNRRILVVLLPALEKAPEELANLGKIIIASLKGMMAAGLGDAVEGDYRDVILRKPTNCPSPYVCIMDEYGYYAVQGFAVVPAQARSLGFSAIFAGQDLPAFQKASKEEAASIGANCNIKICMKLEDPMETWQFFEKVAGEAYVTNVSGFQMNAGSMSMNYSDTRNASVDKRARIDLLDLKDQREGEAHMFFKSRIVRMEFFFANPKPVPRMRIGHFLKVEAPTGLELTNLDKRLRRFSDVFIKDKMAVPALEANDDIKIFAETLATAEGLKPFERGVSALISILENEVSKQREISLPYESGYNGRNISAFTRIEVTPLIEQMIGSSNVELFSLPLIRRGSTSEELIHIERLAGQSATESERISISVIGDIENVTTYPPDILFAKDKRQILQDVNSIISMLGGTPVTGTASRGSGGFATAGDVTTEESSDSATSRSMASAMAESAERGGNAEMPDFADIDSLVSLPDLPDLNELLASATSAASAKESAAKESAAMESTTEPSAVAPSSSVDTEAELPQIPGLADLPDLSSIEKLDKIYADSFVKSDKVKTPQDAAYDQGNMMDLPNLAELPDLPDLDEFEALLRSHGIDINSYKDDDSSDSDDENDDFEISEDDGSDESGKT